MIRTFTHALTGRSMTVRKGTRMERLVEADPNWVEQVEQVETKAGDSRGAGNGGRRRNATRKVADGD